MLTVGTLSGWRSNPRKKVNPMDEITLTAPPTSKKQWVMAFDDSGKKYYYNEVTGESQWEMPDEMKSAKQLEAEAKEKWKQDRIAQGLPVDGDEEYDYKPKGESDDEDEDAMIQSAQGKARIQEEQEKADNAEGSQRA